MNNPIMPVPCEILSVKQESRHEYTYRVKTDIRPKHGQFLQLSIPKIGEAPISVSGQGDGWLDFTIRSVGKVTNDIFRKRAGDTLFLRGAYGNGWPLEQLAGKHLIFITGGTGLAPVRSLLNHCATDPGFARSVRLIAGFKNEEGIIFAEDLARWQKCFQTTYALDKDEKAGWRTGLVTAFIKEIDFHAFDADYAVLIVGPPVMMKYAGLEAVACGVPEEKIWVSFERKMSCAIGKCGHCRIDETYVCLDGPVFNYQQAKYLVD